MASPEGQRPGTGKKKPGKVSARPLRPANLDSPNIVSSKARIEQEAAYRASPKGRAEQKELRRKSDALARQTARAKALKTAQAKERRAEARRVSRKAARYRASPEGIAEATRKAEALRERAEALRERAEALRERAEAARLWSESERARSDAEIAAYIASPEGLAAAEAVRKGFAAAAELKAALNTKRWRDEASYEERMRAEARKVAAYKASPEGLAQALRESERELSLKEMHEATLKKLSRINRPSSG